MTIRRIIKKQLGTLPARFILGCIGRKIDLYPEVNSLLLEAIIERVGEIEEVLPTADFPNPPQSYSDEMGGDKLSTTVILLRERGAYTDLHHLKRKTLIVEKRLSGESGRRFNINPAALGTYGLCLSSHKSTGERPDMGIYAYGVHPHLFFGRKSYYEKIMRWTGKDLESVGRAISGEAFPEYLFVNRIAKFTELVRTLPKNNISVELMSEISLRTQTTP